MENTKIATVKIEMIKFNTGKAELTELADKHRWLKIKWIDDKEWYALVHNWEQEIIKMKTSIKKFWKDWRDNIRSHVTEEQKQEKELLVIIEPVELELKEEKRKIKEELEVNKKRLLQARVDELSKFNYNHDLITLEKMKDEDYKRLVETKKTEFEEAEKLRLEEEAETKRLKYEEDKKRKEDQEAQDKIRKEQKEAQDKIDEANKKIKEDQDKIDEDNKKLQDEKDEMQKKKDTDKAVKEAEARTKKETEDRIKREQEEEEENERLKKIQDDKEEKEKQEILEKETKYKNFLKKNWYVDDWSFKIFKEKWKIILYKKLDELKI